MELTFGSPEDDEKNRDKSFDDKKEDTSFSSLYGDLYGKNSSVSSSLEDSRKALHDAEEALSQMQKTFLQGEDANRARLRQIYADVEKDFGAKPGTLSGEQTDSASLEEKKDTAPAAGAGSSSQEKENKKEPETDPMDDLNELIGLTSIKHDVKELYDFTKIQKMREDAGMKVVPVSKHLVFTGNPGTGKTTVARILARLYKKIGVLSKGQLVECDRSGLVAGYVGQTAVKTQKKIQEAMGGVLFIDEAYSLAKGDQTNDFGQEAIDTILKAMEDHRDDFIVIVAGYTRPMEAFINSNPGLRSRFNKYIEFPDYTDDELMQIFDLDCRKYQYTLGEGVRDGVKKELQRRRASAGENFANAREVRNLFEEIVTNQATRIAKISSPDLPTMNTILVCDLTDHPEDVLPEDSGKTSKEKAGAQDPKAPAAEKK